MLADAEHKAHHELVERVVRRLSRELDLTCDPEDLKAWGHQGVLEAKSRFDPARGVRFSTFAYYRVRGAVLDGVRKQGWLKRRAYAKLKALEAADALGEPLAEVLAQAGAQTPAERAEQISDMLGKISAAYMMSAVGQGEEDRPETPEDMLDAAQTRGVVKDGLAVLPERERSLVQAVYFEGITIEEAGARMGLSKSWASRMHAKALERLRKALSVSLVALALLAWSGGFSAGLAQTNAQPSARSVQDERLARLIARGQALAEAGNAISALAYFRDAISAAPRRSEGYVALGQLYLVLDEPVRALEVFETGARTARSSEALLLGLSAALGKLGQEERALDTLRHLRSLQPTPDGLRALAAAAEARGAFLEALAARRALVELLQGAGAASELAAERGQVRALELLLGGADVVRSRAACSEPASEAVVRALARCP